MSEFIPLLVSSAPPRDSLRPLPEQTFLPAAYRLPDGATKGPISPISPQVVFIEVTNRCNLLCQTCPRTFFDREPLKTLSYAEFVQIAEQFPEMHRALLHGIGEPLLNKELPQIIKYLKGRGVQVIINSNGTLLTPAWQEALVESGLDEYRCSIDGATPETYARIRGANAFHKLVEGLEGLVKTKARLQAKTPRISIWCVGTKENLAELPGLVRLAARLGVPEVYLQRMVYFAREPEQQYGMARDNRAIFGPDHDYQEEIIAACEILSAELGLDFRASGARDPRQSLQAARPADFTPWQACMRPWTTAYVTANGNCLPCCISPFATNNYSSLILGNLFERPFGEIWRDHLYQRFRTDVLSSHPHQACASCGVYWSL
ncbi:MAG TPA: radical SAM protein [Anaerolineae bacterium]|nr:radical SAM protein [Anaerolineae bacterium]